MYLSPFSSATALAILVAAVAATIIGFIWYHPRVFGAAWMRYTGITPEMADRGKHRMPLHALFGLIAGVVVAYVMFWFGAAWGVYDWTGALQLAFWCWIGFIAPILLGTVIWEQKPFRLYLINVLYWLVTFIVIALILLV